MASARTWMVLNPDSDNVAIALKPFEVGESIEGVSVAEPIRQYHKMALTDIALNEPVHKYGQILGYATSPIAAGTWVHNHNLDMGKLMEEGRPILARIRGDSHVDLAAHWRELICDRAIDGMGFTPGAR